MLPLVFKTLNAAGVTDYANGLTPDIELSEDFSNLGQLWQISEPLLARALSDILGQPDPLADQPSRFQDVQELHLQGDTLDGFMYREAHLSDQ